MNVKSRNLQCPDLLYQDSNLLRPVDSHCAICHSPFNVKNQQFCVKCGKQSHGSYVGLGTGSGVKTDRQCVECKVCINWQTQATHHQGCATELTLDRTEVLVCDIYDKSYQPFYVLPLLAYVPELSWKCKNCRICGDRGSRIPGSVILLLFKIPFR